MIHIANILILFLVNYCILVAAVDVDLYECNKSDRTTFITCDKKVGDRLGCCVQKWDEFECQPGDTCKDKDQECVKYYDPDDNSKEIDKRCISKNQDNNKYKDVIITDRETRKFIPSRMNSKNKCNHNLYNTRMKNIWDRYLTCPFDTDYYQTMFKNLINDWNFNNDIFDDSCFSKNIESCSANGQCECFVEIFKEVPPGTKTLLKFDQAKENDHCGLLAGDPCIHNIKALRAKQFPKCKITDSKNKPVMKPFECEVDAGCTTMLHPRNVCPENEICRCKCSEGQSCIGNGQEKTHINFVTIMSLIAMSLTIKFLI